MIKITIENGQPVITAATNDRVRVYLDNDSLIELAKGDELRRKRFINALLRGGSLLFSWANAVEVAGPQGASACAVRAFLDSVGQCWVPVKSNPWAIARCEEPGSEGQAAFSEQLTQAYFQERAHDLSAAGSKVLELSADTFFRLGAVVDWVQNHRDHVRGYGLALDREVREGLGQLRTAYETDAISLDRLLPPIAFDPCRPATFVLTHLQRMLVTEAKAFQFKEHDALDFCHAVVASAYGNIATLDKPWKRRIEDLPKPNHLAKMYYRPQVHELVDMLESRVG